MPVTVPTCRHCGLEFDVGRRTSQESIDKAAADAGWFLWLPHSTALCPEHQYEEEDFADG